MPQAEAQPAVTSRCPADIPREDQLLDRQYVADWLGVDYDTLGVWERQGKGPRVTRVGRGTRYFHRDVQAWLEERRNAGRPPGPRHFRASPKPGLAASPAAKRKVRRKRKASQADSASRVSPSGSST